MSDVLDVITLTEAKQAVNLAAADVSHDTELAAYVTAVSRSLDDLVGPIVQRNVTENRDGGCDSIWLWQPPVVSVSSVVEYDNTTATTLAAETNTVKTADNYAVDLVTGRLRRRASNWPDRFPAGIGNVVVIYVAGRYANTAAVDARFKLAAQIMLANTWRVEQGAGTTIFGASEEPVFGAGFFVPNKVRQLLVDQIKVPRVG